MNTPDGRKLPPPMPSREDARSTDMTDIFLSMSHSKFSDELRKLAPGTHVFLNISMSQVPDPLFLNQWFKNAYDRLQLVTIRATQEEYDNNPRIFQNEEYAGKVVWEKVG